MRTLPAALLLVCLPACVDECTFEGDPGPLPEEEEEWPPPPPPNDAPWFNGVELDDFPPVGPTGVVSVYIEDDQRLSSLNYAFRESGTVDLMLLDDWARSVAVVELTGSMLGEGMGRLELMVIDDRGAWAKTTVESLVVDLSPPHIQLVNAILQPGPDSELEVWVGDAWVLGALELGGGAHLATATGPLAVVTLDAFDLPAGSLLIQAIAEDEAGNSTQVELAIEIAHGAPD